MIRLLIAGKWCEYNDDRLAIAIVKSPTNVEAAQTMVCDIWHNIDISYYNKMKKKGAKREMKAITTTPAFAIGEVIDLSYKNGGLPNRIIIDSVFMREGDTEWMYGVTMECTGGNTTMKQSFIKERKSKCTSAVYKNPDIIKRYREGWRYCGNFDIDAANANGKMIAQRDDVEGVRLYPALDSSNRLMRGKMGVWIKYKYTIYDDGSTSSTSANEFTTIK